MKSVKPGRGPSFMSGIACIGAAVVGVLWTVFSGSMGAPDEFTAFGVIFVLLAIASAVYNLVNATGKNRFSVFDVTEQQAQNRQLLCDIMEKHGFRRFDHEWWHYKLVGEPFPETSFNFPVQ